MSCHKLPDGLIAIGRLQLRMTGKNLGWSFFCLSPWLDALMLQYIHLSILGNKKTHTHVSTYIYIYIYVCVLCTCLQRYTYTFACIHWRYNRYNIYTSSISIYSFVYISCTIHPHKPSPRNSYLSPSHRSCLPTPPAPSSGSPRWPRTHLSQLPAK